MRQKKQTFNWYEHNRHTAYCDDPERVLSFHRYKPYWISFGIQIAFHAGIWGEPAGWRYSLNASVGVGRNTFLLHKRWTLSDYNVWHNDPAFATRTDAIKAALNEVIEMADEQIANKPDGYLLAYYMCLPDWEPFWQLLDTYTAHDNWLSEVRAPKKSAFVQQLELF